MKKRLYILSLSLLVFLSSCLTTLFPIFHVQDVLYNRDLLGYWKCSDKSGETGFITFTNIGNDRKEELPPGVRIIAEKGYLATRSNQNGQALAQYFVFLLKIGKYYYLDYYPADMASKKMVGKDYKDHCIKLHSNYRCDIKSLNSMELKLFDAGFVLDLIGQHQINIKHEKTDDGDLITASTDDLQKFIEKYSDNPKAYGDYITYCTRVTKK
jgi:hypothetical protein